MKKMILSSLATLILSSGSVTLAQTKKETEQEIITLLCHKWKYTKMNTSKTELPLPLKMVGAYLSFKEDGTVSRSGIDGDTPGTWSLDHLNLTLVTGDKKETEKYRLISVTGTELMLRSTINGMQVNLTLERIE